MKKPLISMDKPDGKWLELFIAKAIEILMEEEQKE